MVVCRLIGQYSGVTIREWAGLRDRRWNEVRPRRARKTIEAEKTVGDYGRDEIPPQAGGKRKRLSVGGKDGEVRSFPGGPGWVGCDRGHRAGTRGALYLRTDYTKE